MRSEKEVREKLTKLLEVQAKHTHVPKTCDKCGQFLPIADTWILGDFQYLAAEIDSLKWVLGETDHLTEDHT